VTKPVWHIPFALQEGTLGPRLEESSKRRARFPLIDRALVPRGPEDVPVLRLDGRNIGDSTAIISALSGG
jgi:hypothetical protein